MSFCGGGCRPPMGTDNFYGGGGTTYLAVGGRGLNPPAPNCQVPNIMSFCGGGCRPPMGTDDFYGGGGTTCLAVGGHGLNPPAPNRQLLAPLPIGFAVFLVHLATIPITGTGINPARSLGAAIIYNNKHAWDDHWIFWVGPFIGATLACLYHVVVIRALPFKARHSQ